MAKQAKRRPLRIATWNINSLRLRLPLLPKLIEALAPDVLCLQETKVPDELFPLDGVTALGFEHVRFRGMKGYNGVAILSRHALEAGEKRSFCGRDDCRFLAVTLPGSGIEVSNLYVPAGGDIPDPDENPKFAHKLRFLDEQIAFWSRRAKPGARRVLVGDLNVAPFETDVWSHKQLLDVVSHTPPETERLGRLYASHDWIDAARHFVPEPTRLYSWWSYRNRDWRGSDRGRRLDHIWVSPALKPNLVGVHVLKNVRDWTQTSDHVPVMVDIKVG